MSPAAAGGARDPQGNPRLDDGARIRYEYAWLRAVPSVHRQTFVPVGIVLFARTVDFLALRTRLDEPTMATGWPYLDIDLLARHLEACHRVCEGGNAGGPIGLLPPSERFHWLTTPRSAVLQPSAVRGGLTRDPAAALERLFARSVPERRSLPGG